MGSGVARGWAVESDSDTLFLIETSVLDTHTHH